MAGKSIQNVLKNVVFMNNERYAAQKILKRIKNNVQNALVLFHKFILVVSRD
jgi:hypothetical protein